MPMWIIDLSTLKFLDVNTMAILEYGYSREEFLSMSAIDIRPDDDKELFKQFDRSLAVNPQTYNRGIWRHRKKNGTVINVEITAQDIIFENVPARIVMPNDVTEKKKMEDGLLQSEKRLKEAQEIAQVGSWEIDMSNNVHSWSEGLCKIFGISKGEIVPSRESYLSFIHPDDRDYLNHRMVEAFETLKNSSFNFRFVPKDGAIRYGYSEWKFEFDNSGNAIGLFGIIQDVTEDKLAEIERTKLVNDIMLRNSELEQFAYIVSHNLRAPVANILGASSVLNEPGLSAQENNTLFQGLTSSVRKLDEVINDLNNILQAKQGLNMKREKAVFSKIVDDVKFSIKNLIDKDDIEINYDFSEIDEFTTIKSYLYSIFYNLISNSVKYRQEQVPCRILIKSQRINDEVQLIFTDNGRGFDMEQKRSMVFGLYKRFHRDIEGKGVGLFMVKTQVEALGGKISVTSAVNKGTEFKIEWKEKYE